MTQNILSQTAQTRDIMPKITIERFRVAGPHFNDFEPENRQQSLLGEQKNAFIFTSAYEQLKKANPRNLRPIKPQGTDPFLAFEVKLLGERAQGEAGPYRQFFADISKELMQDYNEHNGMKQYLNLLVPSSNNLAGIGDFRDKFVINSRANTAYEIQLFEFLGKLMGICLRTNVHLTIDLASFYWKQITTNNTQEEGENENVTAQNNQPALFEDLMQINAEFKVLKQYLDQSSRTEFSDENFLALFEEQLEKVRSNSKNDDKQFKLTFDTQNEFLELIVKYHIDQTAEQISAIQRGLFSIIPAPLLNIISWKMLESWICGKKEISIDLLKRHTEYSGGLTSSTPLIMNFWQVLEEFDNFTRLKFIKFCWGQERLPSSDQEFKRNQVRFLIKPMNRTGNHNKALPKADTCFFNIELPNYSNKEILKKQILLAITFDCDAIDAD